MNYFGRSCVTFSLFNPSEHRRCKGMPRIRLCAAKMAERDADKAAWAAKQRAQSLKMLRAQAASRKRAETKALAAVAKVKVPALVARGVFKSAQEGAAFARGLAAVLSDSESRAHLSALFVAYQEAATKRAASEAVLKSFATSPFPTTFSKI